MSGLNFSHTRPSADAGHEKMVTALAVDKAGARVLTGGEDYKLRMFDFGGMKRDMRAFRTLEPEESYPVNALSFSPTGMPLPHFTTKNVEKA